MCFPFSATSVSRRRMKAITPRRRQERNRMTAFNPIDHPHRRYNPLSGQWVLVSPHRAKRLAGPTRGRPHGNAAGARSGLFPVPGQRARHRRSQSGLSRHLRLHQRFRRADERYAAGARQPGSFDAQPERARRQPGDLLLPDHSKTLPELTLPALEQVVATAGANR